MLFSGALAHELPHSVLSFDVTLGEMQNIGTMCKKETDIVTF